MNNWNPLINQGANVFNSGRMDHLNFGLQSPSVNTSATAYNQQPLLNWGNAGTQPVSNTAIQPVGNLGTQPVGGLRESLFGGKNSTGWLTGGMQLGQGALNSYLGLQNYRMGRRQLRDARDNHATNLSNQARTTNMNIYDRYQSRYGGDAGNEALLQWGVSGQSGQTGYTGSNTAGGPTSNSGTQPSSTAPVDTNEPESTRRRNRNL